MQNKNKVLFSNNLVSSINRLLVPVLGILIVSLLVYMVWDLAKRPTEEGFAGSSRLAKLKSGKLKTRGVKTPSPNQSKLSAMKRGQYDANEDLKHYGMNGDKTNDTQSEIANNDLDADISNIGTEIGEKTLNELAQKKSKGKRDNFKNVINEIDHINPGAFDLTSIGGTIRRYNENFNNRLNYAKSKNEGDNLEATMAQGRIIFDEFKKIFLFTDMFA